MCHRFLVSVGRNCGSRLLTRLSLEPSREVATKVVCMLSFSRINGVAAVMFEYESKQ